VRLQDEALQSPSQEFLCQTYVVDAPLDDVGGDMHLEVIGTLNRLPS
jgi:hypothetical protein